MPTIKILSKAMVSTSSLRIMLVASIIYSLPCNVENCVADPFTGKVYGVTNKRGGMALNISHESSAFKANTIQLPYKARKNPHFNISDIGNGTMTLQAIYSGLVVDIDKASLEPSGDILQLGYHDGEDQQWKIKRYGSDSFKIVSQRSG